MKGVGQTFNGTKLPESGKIQQIWKCVGDIYEHMKEMSFVKEKTLPNSNPFYLPSRLGGICLRDTWTSRGGDAWHSSNPRAR
jgi:hypothetical protein